ncbi:hypothetical protein ACLMJK_007789 [Lecanora helva]
MAVEEPNTVTSTDLNGNDAERRTQSTLEKELSILKERFALLEQRVQQIREEDGSKSGSNTEKNNDVPDHSSAQDGTVDGDSESNKEKDSNPTTRARIVINKVDPDTGERKDQPVSESANETSTAQETSHAFTLRKYIHTDGDENGGELEIVSHELWDLLKKLLGSDPEHTFQGDPVTLDAPYEAFIHNWRKLEDATREETVDEKEAQVRSDLRLLLDTLSSGSGDAKLDKYFKNRQSNREQKTITFESLWTLFPPGSLVYGKSFLGQDQVLIVQNNMRTWPYISRKQPQWQLACWTYDWDGKSFSRMSLNIAFDSFEGTKPITSLPFYPIDHHQDPSKLKERLVERGKKYKKLCLAERGSQMFDYKGSILIGKKGFSGLSGGNEDDDMTESSYDREYDYSERGPDPNSAASKPSYSEGRVMVDFESYFRYGPSFAKIGSLDLLTENQDCACIRCQNNVELNEMYRRRFDKNDGRKEWENEQYMLCPPRILGYILRDKQWAQLEVSSLQEIPSVDPNDSLDRVKLADGEQTKKMILNLVNSHTSADSKDDDSGLTVDDIVAKKGKGLVILLYGPPGVGKTSTAETVAIAAQKPLFSISVADVGTEAKKVEGNLEKIFALATSWQAILLIDEADVFLESRSKGTGPNTERNALVSVFLRVLEYYQGILMLTTNQIAYFDVAVQSRIHIAIKYGSLTKDQTIEIFEAFLQPLVKKDRVKNIDKIMKWIKEDVWKVGLDGRQIRNILTSALGIARAEHKRRLELKDLKVILDNVKDYKIDFTKQFEKYKNMQDGMVG